jgi:hypothetical protein
MDFGQVAATGSQARSQVSNDPHVFLATGPLVDPVAEEATRTGTCPHAPVVAVFPVLLGADISNWRPLQWVRDRPPWRCADLDSV